MSIMQENEAKEPPSSRLEGTKKHTIFDFNKKEKIHQSFYDSGGFFVRRNINCLSFSDKVLIFHSLI